MDGIGWAASAMVSARSRLDIATNNLANASSDGFRKQVSRGELTESGASLRVEQSAEQGALRRTGRPFDLAILGSGAFTLRDQSGRAFQSRNGAFTRDRFGALRNDAGAVLMGMRGPLRVPQGATLRADGSVLDGGVFVDRVPLGPGATLKTGYLEGSDVNSIGEMVDVLGAQRSFESAQKVVSAIDATHQKASNELARLK